MKHSGRDFEEAVYEFVRELDPGASVIFDHRVPDRDTGAPRQVDVWVEYALCGHYPASILISCKDHAKRLDVGAVETFASEIRSTGATMGILYSRSGFTENALEKGKALGISCCRLFENAPPEKPSDLFVRVYIAHPAFTILMEPPPADHPAELRWKDLPPALTLAGRAPFGKWLQHVCTEVLFHCQRSPQVGLSAGDMVVSVPATGAHPRLRLRVALTWEWARARVNAFRLNGSLNISAGEFVGDALLPAVPLAGMPFADEWEPCLGPPEDDGQLSISITTLAVPSVQQITAVMGDAPVFGGGPWRLALSPGSAFPLQLPVANEAGAAKGTLAMQLRWPPRKAGN